MTSIESGIKSLDLIQDRGAVIDALTAEVLIEDYTRFISLRQLLDYISVLKKASTNFKNVNIELNENNFVLITNEGIQITDSNYSSIDTKNIFCYHQQMFSSIDEDMVNGDLLWLDPLPNLIKPVKPLNNSNISLKGWLVALEDDVDVYFTNVIANFNSTHGHFISILTNLMLYLDVFYNRNLTYNPSQLDIKDMFLFDYNAVITNLQQIQPTPDFSLINLIDLNKFDSFYLKFKDLKAKISAFVTNIINEHFYRLSGSYKSLQKSQKNLKHQIASLVTGSLEFEIDQLMFNKFKLLVKKLENDDRSDGDINVYAGQVNTLYTIANSLFAKSNEILILKRNIQKYIINFISTDLTNHQIKIVNLKNLINKDLSENLSLLKSQYQALIFLKYDLPLIYGSNLLEIYRKKVYFKLKYLLKFHNLVIKKNSWIEEDIEKEIIVRNKFLSSFDQLKDIKFIDYNLFSQRFQFKKTFTDIKHLKKHLNLGEEDDKGLINSNEKLDKETIDIVNYCDMLNKTGLTDISENLSQKFEDLKKDILNQSQTLLKESQECLNQNNLIVSLESKVDTLKSKLVLQELFDVDDWPIQFSKAPVKETIADQYEDNQKTVNFLIEELEKQKVANRELKIDLHEQIVTFKHDFTTNSNINTSLVLENDLLKKENEALTNLNKHLTQNVKASILRDVSLLEKIGLLLNTKEMKINRVKGLKKPNSNMSESTILLSNEFDITESVNVKADVSSLTEITEDEELIKFDNDFRQVYIKSVEKRFVDLEDLAKRLNKENKQLKKQVKKVTNETKQDV
ncbi:hypothetical protein QEN19_003762 [Hanseniaspora menglaensis]